MTIVSDSAPVVKPRAQALARDAALVLAAEKAREYAAIHWSACRYRRQGLACSTCHDLDARAARLAKLAGGVA